MQDKIINIFRQMHKSEQRELLQHIEAQYGLKEKSGMLRDDIVLKLTQLLEVEHTWLMDLKEEDTFRELDLTPPDITLFADTIAKEFELEEVNFAKMMEWSTVKDIVDYIEDNLENDG